ncbi:MAG: 5-formyltetrahydrofolate cyclo-ligase [Clostridia bacterium]|nr:5-formyltetrahydrofolate cyclo-ligase [Clostridia bacterium]
MSEVLKDQLRAKVRGIVPADTDTADKKIRERILTHPWMKEARSVFIYVSMQGEPDTRVLIGECLREGKTVLVPKCVSKTEMIAVRIRDLEELTPGALGIPEPPDSLSWTGDISLALVPCVAASRDGARIGHGAGYYDRFLARHKTRTICLCYQERLLDAVPMDADDIYMDAVITQSETILPKGE